MSSYPNRSPIRKAIAAQLTTALSGLATVYDYLVVDPSNQTPLVYVASSSSLPDADEPYSGSTALLGFDVGVMVMYAKPNVWTPAQCEDLSDDLCKRVWDTVRANAENALWSDLFVAGQSEPSNVTISGQRYRIEIIPVTCKATG